MRRALRWCGGAAGAGRGATKERACCRRPLTSLRVNTRLSCPQMPKSVSCTTPPLLSSTLCGLRSLCRTRWACRCCNASATWRGRKGKGGQRGCGLATTVGWRPKAGPAWMRAATTSRQLARTTDLLVPSRRRHSWSHLQEDGPHLPLCQAAASCCLLPAQGEQATGKDLRLGSPSLLLSMPPPAHRAACRSAHAAPVQFSVNSSRAHSL